MHQVQDRQTSRAGFRRCTIFYLVPIAASLAAITLALMPGLSPTTLGMAGAPDSAETAAWGLVPSSSQPPRVPGSASGSLTGMTMSKPSTTTTTAPRAPSTTTPPGSTTTTTPVSKALSPTTTTTTPVSKALSPTTTTTTAPKVPPTTTPPGSTGTSSAPAPIPSNCSTDVSASLTAHLDSLPSGAVFSSPAGACYLVDEGLDITHPLTMIGGTLEDESSTTTPTGSGHFRPIIEILDTSNVTISDMTIEGSNATGSYHPSRVGEAGIKVLSSSDVTLDNIRVTNTFGDGLELMADLGHRKATPDTGLVVNGYATTNAGRQGMTFAEVDHATLTNIHIVHPADAGFDFESDEPGLGSGNVAISNCTYDHGLNLIEHLTGPLSLTDCSGSSSVLILDRESDQPVTFTGGSLKCLVRSPRPCVHQSGGILTLSHMALTRIRSNEVMTEPAWSVVNGGHLSLVDVTVDGPMGIKDATSTVTLSE